MSLNDFEDLNRQLVPLTKELAYHIVGDPLVLSNLGEYLNISEKYKLKVNLTTTANNLAKKHYEALSSNTLKQINFSLNSYNANSHKKSLDEYLNPIFDFVEFIQSRGHEFFINFRIWNLDEIKSAKEFNKKLFDKINQRFKSDIDIDEVYKNKPKNIRVGRKFFIHFDEYFNWPSLHNKEVSKKGFCYGLDSHFGILASGELIPCCLDQNANVNLGDTKTAQLVDILNSTRARNMKDGFKNNILVEELCTKCEYRVRFNKD